MTARQLRLICLKWTFKPIDREMPARFPGCVQDYLPEVHLARFVVKVVEMLDLTAFTSTYKGTGSKVWHPSLRQPDAGQVERIRAPQTIYNQRRHCRSVRPNLQVNPMKPWVSLAIEQ